ncbi:hypothetical protein [Parvicella tangerina]|uniref:hypothetical protein n=1 Tax=Parvicella tangerina TaxID=2829795 RepID=UPI00215B9E2E|nr:hypothetical protein [Parvicella tangerina]
MGALFFLISCSSGSSTELYPEDCAYCQCIKESLIDHGVDPQELKKFEDYLVKNGQLNDNPDGRYEELMKKMTVSSGGDFPVTSEYEIPNFRWGEMKFYIGCHHKTYPKTNPISKLQKATKSKTYSNFSDIATIYYESLDKQDFSSPEIRITLLLLTYQLAELNSPSIHENLPRKD